MYSFIKIDNTPRKHDLKKKIESAPPDKNATQVNVLWFNGFGEENVHFFSYRFLNHRPR